MVDLWRDFWIRETGTGQQVAQLHERYDDDDDDIKVDLKGIVCEVVNWSHLAKNIAKQWSLVKSAVKHRLSKVLEKLFQ